jgi:hypothetical protein
MATVTPNFNWPVPTSTDLVKDGATAIEALGDSIDASLVDLKGGTTGQVLSKTSGTDMDFTWVTSDDANAIQNTIVDAKGDLIAATAADTPARLAVGTNGQVLTADSTAATGLAWATASGGSTNVAGKNVILNSGFNVWQRGTSFTIPNGVPTFFADRFQTTRSATGCTATRQSTNDTTNLPFIQYCGRIARDSGNTSTTPIYVTYSMDTVNTIPLANKTVTLSYYARSGANYSASGNSLGIIVNTGTGTDENVNAGYVGSSTLLSTNVTLTTTWQRFTHTFAIGSTATELGFYHTFTPTGTAGANDYFEITGYQLEIAGSASAYSPNTSTYQAELAACQRYYIRYTNAAGNRFPAIGYAQNTTTARLLVTFPVTMRTVPSTFEQTGSGGDYALGYLLTAAVCSAAPNQLNSSAAGATIQATLSSGLTAGIGAEFYAQNANAYLGWSAEL